MRVALAWLTLTGLAGSQVLPDSVYLRLKQQGINPYAAPPSPPGAPRPLSLPESDCSGAIRLCTNTYNYPGGIPDAGAVSELGNDGRGTCLTGGEHRTVWFIFTVQSSGTMGFLLCPNAATGNDYDFAMWDVTGLPNPCSIFSGTGNVPPPVRCNFSVPNATTCCGGVTCGNDGLTGLDHTNPQPGNLSYGASGPAVMPGLNVTAGQTFLLVVDNWSNNNVGFSITFYGTAQYFDATPPQLDSAYRVCSPTYENQLGALTQLRVRFNELIDVSTVAANGGDFIVIDNTTTAAVPVTAATPINPPQTNTVELSLSQPLVPGRSYTVHVAYNGTSSDGNAIADQCGVSVPLSSIPLGGSATSYTFTVLDTLDIQVLTTGPRCVGTATGSVSAQVSGGRQPYEYALLPGVGTTPPTVGWGSTSTWTGRAAGTYSLWVRDAMGCVQRRVVQLVDPPALSVVVQDSLLRDCGGRAFVQLNGSGGTPPYEFSILPVSPAWQANGYFGGLAVGTYTLRVRDANGCVATRSISVQPGNPVTLALVQIDTVRCAGETGGFTVQAGGGNGGGFTYTLTPGGQTSTTGAFTGLSGGIYQVRATDGVGCWETLTVLLPEPAPLTVQDSTLTPSTCLRGADGAITLTIAGGNAPYTFQWTGPGGAPLASTSSTVTALAPGVYTVQVTDRKGCFLGPLSYSVGYMYDAQIQGVSTQLVEDCPAKKYRFEMVAAGVPPFSYRWTWDDGTQETTQAPQIEHTYDPLRSGPVSIRVEVFSGGVCKAETTFTLELVACSGLIFPTVISPNGDGLNDRWAIQALGFDRYTVLIYDRWGVEVWSNSGDPARVWEGRDKNGRDLPEGAYVFVFTGTDRNGKAVRRSGTVTLLR